jgi:NAD(P)-dependent dehydrogenase (short-subunit alcohol dehydrogenase family)
MQEFRDKVAVVTGAASGIGRGLAARCVKEGMKVVLADVEEPALQQAAEELRAAGGRVLAVHTDVSKAKGVAALARQTLDAFGAVHLLCNNAGVAAGGSIWESTLADWEWVMGVNLWGTIHGLRTFVPIMLAQKTEGYVLNTASITGLLPYYHSAPYQISKHAVVALSENLHYSLQEQKVPIGVSVLCPGWVNTRIVEAGRNRPPELRNPMSGERPTPEQQAAYLEAVRTLQAGLSPEKVADLAFAGIREGRLYILTEAEFVPAIRERMEKMLQGHREG